MESVRQSNLLRLDEYKITSCMKYSVISLISCGLLTYWSCIAVVLRELLACLLHVLLFITNVGLLSYK